MVKLALLGKNIEYTQSPKVHAAIASAIGERMEFNVYDVTYDRLEQAVSTLLKDCDGFFVTKPYKYDVKKYLDCSIAGGVNLVRSRDKAVFNTDGLGFIRALDRNFKDWRKDVNAALVLGAGGAAYSVAQAMIEQGKRVYILNRTLMHAVKLCSAVGAEMYVNQPAELIVNCTSAGLNGEDVLRGLCVLPDFDYAFDLIYSAGVTPFLRRLCAAGAKTADGKDMLLYQAIEGDGILLGTDFDVESVFDKVKKLLNK